MKNCPLALLLLATGSLALMACSSSDDTGTATEPEETKHPGAPPETPEPPETAEAPGEACNIDTGFDGDDNCIAPPAADEGFQIHVGPTDYDDPDDVSRFLLMPGTETVECWHTTTGNDHDIYTRQRRYRMRPGSHHLILKEANGAAPAEEGWGDCPDGLSGSFGGSQNSVTDSGFGDIAPEDAGYASLIEANTHTAAEVHYFNAIEDPVLREVWVNIYEADPDTVTDTWRGVSLIGLNGLRVKPGATENIRYSSVNTLENRRIAGMVGHVHSHTTRMSVWHVSGEDRQLVYELYDWAEPKGIAFNTLTKNPKPDATTLTEGGYSGLLNLAVGDRIEWECEVSNDLEFDLVFANEALTAEMCIVFGRTVESAWSDIPQRVYEE